MKTILITAILLSCGWAHAFEDITQPFELHCHGTEGFFDFEQTSSGINYNVNIPGQYFFGFVNPQINTVSHWEDSSAAYLEPADENNKKWLSVSISYGKKVWVPPSEGCMPTRNGEAPCLHITNPGYYSEVPDVWITALVDVSAPGHVDFMNLDFDKPSLITSLGNDSQCSLTGL